MKFFTKKVCESGPGKTLSNKDLVFTIVHLWATSLS